jgi:hypothetical protein
MFVLLYFKLHAQHRTGVDCEQPCGMLEKICSFVRVFIFILFSGNLNKAPQLLMAEAHRASFVGYVSEAFTTNLNLKAFVSLLVSKALNSQFTSNPLHKLDTLRHYS